MPAALVGTGLDGAVTLADVELATRRGNDTAARSPGVNRRPHRAAPGFDRGGDAQGDRRRDGALEARDPALLSEPHGRSRRGAGLARSFQRRTTGAGQAVARGAAAEGSRARRCARCRSSTDLCRRRVPPGDGIHVGWAISLRGGGLVAPAIRDADKRSLTELMAAMRDLVQRARTGGLRSSELLRPTVTVTSLGERGAESVYGIIYPPQVAIIGFGTVLTRPWVVDGASGRGRSLPSRSRPITGRATAIPAPAC